MTTIPDDVIEAMVVSYYDQPGDDTEAGWHIEAMRAALAAAEAKGWKLVPREPNEDMTGAFDRHCDEHGQCMVKTGWRAMHDAAPKVKL